jgi:hypothetical protein
VSDPHPSRVEDRDVDDAEKYYNISKKPRLFGGNWRVYSKDEQTRPDGVTEEYTFDLTTLSIKRN